MVKIEDQNIKKELQTIIGILLNQSKIQEKNLGEKIRYLALLKYENQEIADMLGTTYSMAAKEKSKASKVKNNKWSRNYW